MPPIYLKDDNQTQGGVYVTVCVNKTPSPENLHQRFEFALKNKLHFDNVCH